MRDLERTPSGPLVVVYLLRMSTDEAVLATSPSADDEDDHKGHATDRYLYEGPSSLAQKSGNNQFLIPLSLS